MKAPVEENGSKAFVFYPFCVSCSCYFFVQGVPRQESESLSEKFGHFYNDGMYNLKAHGINTYSLIHHIFSPEMYRQFLFAFLNLANLHLSCLSSIHKPLTAEDMA